ncbi:MAG: hypothetical protein WC745_03180 [Patescibacteria group bacterium]|jgi:hypothetical protein
MLSIFLFVIVVVGPVFGLAMWGLWALYHGWNDDNTVAPPKPGYRTKAITLWRGEKKERVKELKSGQQMLAKDVKGNQLYDRVKGVRDILKEKGGLLFLMYFLSLVVLFLTHVLGDVGVSLIYGAIVGFFSTWSGKIDKRKGLMVGFVAFIFSLVSESLARAPLFIAANLFFSLGPPTYVYEEVKKKDTYPWIMLDICFYMILINVGLVVLYLAGVDHAAMVRAVAGLVDNGLIKHGLAEAERALATGNHLLDIIKWFMTIILILIVAGPGELAGKIKKIREEAKTKGTTGLTTGRYFLYEAIIETIDHLFEAGKRKITPTK